MNNTIFPPSFQKCFSDLCAEILFSRRLDGLLIGESNFFLDKSLVSMRYFSGKPSDHFSKHCGRMFFRISKTLNSCSEQTDFKWFFKIFWNQINWFCGDLANFGDDFFWTIVIISSFWVAVVFQTDLEISLQTKLCECFYNFLGLAKFLRLGETIDWLKLLIFGRTCSNWQGAIGMNTKTGKSTIFKAETE